MISGLWHVYIVYLIHMRKFLDKIDLKQTTAKSKFDILVHSLWQHLFWQLPAVQVFDLLRK